LAKSTRNFTFEKPSSEEREGEEERMEEQDEGATEQEPGREDLPDHQVSSQVIHTQHVEPDNHGLYAQELHLAF